MAGRAWCTADPKSWSEAGDGRCRGKSCGRAGYCVATHQRRGGRRAARTTAVGFRELSREGPPPSLHTTFIPRSLLCLQSLLRCQTLGGVLFWPPSLALRAPRRGHAAVRTCSWLPCVSLPDRSGGQDPTSHCRPRHPAQGCGGLPHARHWTQGTPAAPGRGWVADESCLGEVRGPESPGAQSGSPSPRGPESTIALGPHMPELGPGGVWAAPSLV